MTGHDESKILSGNESVTFVKRNAVSRRSRSGGRSKAKDGLLAIKSRQIEHNEVSCLGVMVEQKKKEEKRK